MHENRPANVRLDSWKDIATYLGRDIRTAMRWEKNGLPVHRVPGVRRQAVFAYTDEIDTWLVSQDKESLGVNLSDSPSEPIEESEETSSESLPDVQLPEPGEPIVPLVHSRKWISLIAGAFLVLLAGGIYFLLAHSHRAGSLRPLVTRLTDDGRDKTSLRTDGTTLYFNETEGSRKILVSSPMTGSPIRTIETPFSNVQLQDVSNDGKTLLVMSYEGMAEEGPLWTLPSQGGTPHQVGDVLCGMARWSPNNRKIACSVRTMIVVMNADGSNAQPVGSFSSHVGQVLWTPDGLRLRFALEGITEGTYSAWEIPASKNAIDAPAQQIPLISTCLDWTWTQSGKAFVYARCDPDGRGRLMVAPENGLQTGMGEAELPVNIGAILGITSVKGRDTLYLLIGNAPRGELLKFDGNQRAFQTFLPGVSAAYLAFSGDGQWMTYSNTLDYSLWRSRSDGSESLRLSKPPMEIQVSSWAPDGRRIAFMGRKPGQTWRIFVIDRDGHNEVEAGEGNDNQGGPSWSPDGKMLVYGNTPCEKTQNCWIRRLDLATRKVEIVPGSSGFRTARWSPDGKYIVALSPKTHELMLFNVSTQRWSVRAGSISGDNINWSSDSQYVYVDSPREKEPVIERVRIKDGHRVTVASLASLDKGPGHISPWIGLTPDNSPIVLHMLDASEVYALEWTNR
jgi:Tol biopolymer transport system component